MPKDDLSHKCLFGLSQARNSKKGSNFLDFLLYTDKIGIIISPKYGDWKNGCGKVCEMMSS